MISTYSTGGDIDAWCTQCKLELGHTIVAIVDNVPKKVQCNTCKGQHNFRVKPSGESRAKSTVSSRKRGQKETTYEEHISRLGGGDHSGFRRYDTHENYEKDEFIDHLSFGIGIVLSVIQRNKIKILFKDGPRLLIQNQ